MMNQKLERFTGGRTSVRNKLNALVDAQNNQLGIIGDTYILVTQAGGRIAIKLAVETLLARIPKTRQSNLVSCRIAGATALATNGPGGTATEWRYSVVPVTFGVNAGSLTRTDASGPTIEAAWNGIEHGNRNVTAGGTFGNGVKYDDLSNDDFEGSIQPIKTGDIVECRLFVAADGEDEPKTYAIFSASNGIKGSCKED